MEENIMRTQRSVNGGELLSHHMICMNWIDTALNKKGPNLLLLRILIMVFHPIGSWFKDYHNKYNKKKSES